jgi:uncharacterized protein YjcR
MEKARQIRQMWKDGMTCPAIAKYFGVPKGTISHVIYNYNWRED